MYDDDREALTEMVGKMVGRAVMGPRTQEHLRRLQLLLLELAKQVERMVGVREGKR